RFHNIFIFFFAAILVSIVFITVLFYRNTKDYQSTSQSVSHTHIVLEEAEEIFSFSGELQLESAGYYYTGNGSFLPAFTKAKTELSHRLTNIRQLTVDNALQQQRIDSLQVLINNLIH